MRVKCRDRFVTIFRKLFKCNVTLQTCRLMLIQSITTCHALLFPASSGRTLSKAEEERHASIAMETWLKDKFREGAQRMKAEFDKLDAENSGKVINRITLFTLLSGDVMCIICSESVLSFKVRGEDFLQVLRKFDLHLRREHLGMFLSRCGLKLRKGSVHYLNFLRNFQDRSSDGITHKIISNPKHR